MASPTLEAELPRSAVYDASLVLPRRDKGRHKQPRFRDVGLIQYTIVHKSGADGPAGLRGAMGMANFVINHRGWDDPAYTFWFPRVCELDGRGRPIWYRCNADAVRSFHTGGRMNVEGVGLGVQGNYDGDGGVIERHPTEQQMMCLQDALDYCERIYPLFRRTGSDAHGDKLLTGHWEHGKIVCPGDALQAWVRLQRGGDIREMVIETPDSVELDFNTLSILERQFALKHLGFDVGPLDGMWGYQSRAALERFQTAQGLRPDGHWGKHTASAMLLAMRAANMMSARIVFMDALERAKKA